MSLSNFIYRQKQKWKYHATSSLFEKKVAEINRNHQIIDLQLSSFTIKGCELIFSRKHHSFIIDRFGLFIALLKGGGTFQILQDNLLFTTGGVQLRVTTAEEIFIIYEIFNDGCYRVFTQRSFNVIDIGMNVGFASLFFAGNSNVGKVIGFEPFRPTYQDAQFNFSLNPGISSKITSFNFGLGLNSRKITMPYSPDLKGKNSSVVKNSGSEEIELKEAVEVFDQVGKNHRGDLFFVKMDCEGAEFEIFESLKQKPILAEIFGFIIEWHHRDPMPIIEILLANEFKVQQRGNIEIGLIIAFR
jgi:FkbM family methyltransferase